MSGDATPRLEIWGVEGLPEVTSGDDLGALLLRSGLALRDGDVLVVTSKIVSKAEGRLVAGTRDEHLDDETARVVASRGNTRIVQTHHGFVMAAAGIDASNVPAGTVALLPLDSDRSAETIRQRLHAETGADVAVIISDTMGRPWRAGVVDAAIGAAGLDVLWDLRGLVDPAGHLLEATVVAVADELASAADLVKGKLTATPVAVIRGFPFSRHESRRGARPLVRPSEEDMFRLGTRDAQEQIVTLSAPVRATGTDRTAVDSGAVRRAVAALGVRDQLGPVEVTVSGDGATITMTGQPFATGVTVGRLLAALAVEGLRGDVEPRTDAVAAVVHVLI